jgi:ABC-type thiamin/hydroxymethylpyrimidine transport system permease subunit
MTYSVRDLVYIGVFAACWGAIEITVGSLLHALRVPFGGAFLTGAGVTIALVGRLYVPRPGAAFLIGLVTALLKMLSVGGIVLSPMIAISFEGLIAEACVLGVGASRVGFLVAGAATCLYPLAHTLVSTWIRGGAGLFASYITIIERGAGALGVPVAWGWGVLALLAGLHVTIGLAAGTAAWTVGQGLRRRGRAWGGDERP